VTPPPDASGRVGFLVVGSPRSGTTLVQRLACEIPGVRIPPETHFFSEFAPGLIERRRFPLGPAEITEEIDRFLALDSARGLQLDPDGVVDELGGACQSAYALFDALVRALAGPAELWGEKTPGHLLWWRPLATTAPWLRFVVVVRDPRAVVASNLEMPWRDDPRVPAWGERRHLAFAVQWRRFQHEVLAMRQALAPDRRLVLRYEDLVTDPDGARAAMAAFLGRAPGDAAPTRAEGPAPVDIVLPWESWKRDALGPVRPELAERWREVLDERRAEEVATVCRGPMRRFGYDGAPGPARATAVLARLGPRPVAALARYRRAYDRYADAIERRRLGPPPSSR